MVELSLFGSKLAPGGALVVPSGASLGPALGRFWNMVATEIHAAQRNYQGDFGTPQIDSLWDEKK